MEPQTEPRRRRRPQPISIEPDPEIEVQSVQKVPIPTPINQSPIVNDEPVKKTKIKKKSRKPRKVRTKRSFCQFLSAAIMIAYTIFVIQYFFDISVNQTRESTMDAISGTLATMLVTPHMLLCAISSVFSAAGFIVNSRGFSLTAAILECVAAVVFLMYAPFLIPSIILGFIGYVRIGSLKKNARRYI